MSLSARCRWATSPRTAPTAYHLNRVVPALAGSVAPGDVSGSGFFGHSIYNKFTVSAETSVLQLRWALQGATPANVTIGLALASAVGAGAGGATLLSSAPLSIPSPPGFYHEYAVTIPTVVLSPGITYAFMCISAAAAYGPNGADPAFYGRLSGTLTGVINSRVDGCIYYSQNGGAWTNFGAGSFGWGLN